MSPGFQILSVLESSWQILLNGLDNPFSYAILNIGLRGCRKITLDDMRYDIHATVSRVIGRAGEGQFGIDNRNSRKQRLPPDPGFLVGFPIGNDPPRIGLAAGGGYGGDTDYRQRLFDNPLRFVGA